MWRDIKTVANFAPPIRNRPILVTRDVSIVSGNQ